MALLILGAERRELRVGRNTIGGAGEAMFSAFKEVPPVAVLILEENREATIASLDPTAHILIDGVALGAEPKRLRDGAHLRIAALDLVYRAESTDHQASAVPPPSPDQGASAGDRHPWRLIELPSGRVHDIPALGLVIGRDGECDIVVPSQDVSRRHAVIRRAGTGCTVTDESANGTFVNDVPVQSVQTLARGDTLRIGTSVFRLERPTPPSGGPGVATQRIPSMPGAAARALAAPATAAAAAPAPKAPQTPRPPAHTSELARLEIRNGPRRGTRLALTRAVCSIGRTEDNDIVVADESVSALQATLLFKAGSWYVVDLRSANGTFVDGYRVAGERVLPAGSVLTIGQVKMVFWPVSRPGDRAHGTRRLVSMLQRWARLIRNR